jgi:hypothetical protein
MDTMPKHYFLNKLQSNRRLSAIVVIVIVAGIGTYLLLSSHAASPYVSITANSGTPTGSATLVPNCSGATDTSCVMFGSGSTSSLYSGKLLGLNSSTSDLSEVGNSKAWQQLGVNSVRGELDLSGTAFADPNYDGTVAQWLDTTTSEHIVPEPLLNQYVEMDTINTSQFVTATVNWCKAYCAGGTFYNAASQASQSTKADPMYAPQVLEILNEPYGNWWGYPVTTTDVNAYATLLKDIRAGMNTAGLNNIGILAAANDNWGGTENWNTDLVNNGGFAAAQGVTEHPYGVVDTSCTPSTSTTDCTVTSGDTDGTNTAGWGEVYYINKFLTTNGLTAQANNVYVTEVGYCNGTTSDDCSGGTFTETIKDQDITAIIGQLASVPWLKAIEYFNLIPYQDSGVYNTYGLYSPYPALAETPAWTTYQTAAAANGL